MPSPSVGSKVVQLQLEVSKIEAMDSISYRTHVPRATLLRMAIDAFLEAAASGKLQMGISLLGSSAPGSSGAQAAFKVVEDPKAAPPPPPPAPGV
jgi:hypothetical protein